MKRHATEDEQKAIDRMNEIAAEVGLVITELQDEKEGGAVIPTKGF